jgi:hypothetical protein
VPPPGTPAIPPPGAPPGAFPVPPAALPLPPGPGKIGTGFGGTGAGKPGSPGAGNGAGSSPRAGMSTAPTFIAVNAMKEEPNTRILTTRASLCMLSSLSKQHAYSVSGSIDDPCSELLIQFDGEGTSSWLKKFHYGASHRVITPADPTSHRASKDWHHSCTSGVHAREILRTRAGDLRSAWRSA